MIEIIPAVLPKNYQEMEEKVKLAKNFASLVQIDICDGIFVKNITWPFDLKSKNIDSEFQKILREEEGLPYWQEIDYEFDLMVKKASDNFDLFLKLGAKNLIFHLEAEVDNLEDIEQKKYFLEFLEGVNSYIKEYANLGLAINVETPIDTLDYFLENVSFVQLMGIKNIGQQGEPLETKVIEKIKELRKKYPLLKINVDGGINLQNAPEIIKAGASSLVIGSSIFKSPNPEKAYKTFQELE